MSESMPETKLIVGLGNPGKEYQDTRHNIGFRVLEKFLAREAIEAKLEKKIKALVGSKLLTQVISSKSDEEEPETLERKSVKVIFAMPQTYMNLSGDAAQKLMQFYKLQRKDILVVHDDVALDTGSMKLSLNRGAGGQHGVEDIIAKCGGKDFYRLRLGIGPDPGGDERADYVLKKFPKSQSDQVDSMLLQSMKALENWIFSEHESPEMSKLTEFCNS